jgi:uncharacterized protein (UPF0261 family)
MTSARRAAIAGTFDTKAPELLYLRDRLQAAGVPTLTIDVSTRPGGVATDVAAATVAACHPGGVGAVLGLDDRGRAVTAMAEAFASFVRGRDDIAGLIGAGGSGNSVIVSAGMRALPTGLPKVLVSTLGSGNTAPFVGVSDIAVMHAVTDVQGLNRISRRVLGNAAHALAGMLTHAVPVPAGDERPPVALTMFGVTTPCVQACAARLSDRFDPVVFHATGTGGRAMEKLVDDGFFAAVLDVTTTEIADELVGGILTAGPDRLGAIARTGVPYVGSCGALDMVNFGARDTVPARFAGRRLHVHNPTVTLMRTDPEECARIGRWIAERLNQCPGEVRFLVPERGFSAIAVAGQPFHDPAADRALIDALERTLVPSPRRRLEILPLAINEPAFAEALVAALLGVVQPRPE